MATFVGTFCLSCSEEQCTRIIHAPGQTCPNTGRYYPTEKEVKPQVPARHADPCPHCGGVTAYVSVTETRAWFRCSDCLFEYAELHTNGRTAA